MGNLIRLARPEVGDIIVVREFDMRDRHWPDGVDHLVNVKIRVDYIYGRTGRPTPRATTMVEGRVLDTNDPITVELENDRWEWA